MNALSIGRRLALGFGFAIALGLAVAVVALVNLYALQQQFGDYETRMVARERLALRGQVELGNGIHYFKNTVLRGGDYPAKFARSMDALERIADDYRALGPVGADAERALGEIRAGSARYRSAVTQAMALRAGGASIADVDKAIAGADKPIGAALATLRAKLADVSWEKALLNGAVKETCTAHGLKMPQVAIPLRVAILGQPQTPSIDAVLETMGRDLVLGRLDRVL